MGNSLKFLIQYGHPRASEWAGICFLQAKAVFASLTWQAEPWRWRLREQLPILAQYSYQDRKQTQ